MTESNAPRQSPLRLAYDLHTRGRGHPTSVAASSKSGERLGESELKRSLARLHPLDQTIARELLSSAVYGNLNDAQLARLVPLFVHRETRVDGEALCVIEDALTPRVEVAPAEDGALQLTLFLQNRARERVALEDGRLLAGTQAYFLVGHTVYGVVSGAPWDLAAWSRRPVLALATSLDPGARDELVHTLSRLGVPPSDLQLLAVRRAPPDRILAELSFANAEKDIEALLTLFADYGGELTLITPRHGAAGLLIACGTGGMGLIERDLGAEHIAFEQVHAAGFRFDAKRACFVARGDLALRVLDPETTSLPASFEVTRSGGVPKFHHALKLQSRVQLLEDRGLLELSVALGGASEEEQKLAALLGMKELLAWLASGSDYLALADGSFVAPSPKLRRSLRVLRDLGIDHERALISPLSIGLLRVLGDSSALAAADAATAAWLEELSGNSAPTPTSVPKEIAQVLRDYQHHGLDWLMMLHRHRLTGILADDMGLGKTLQALALLLAVRDLEGTKPSLVVAPTSVLSVWRDEVARFAPSLEVLIWEGSPAERQELTLDGTDLVVTSYGILRRDVERLATQPFRYVILDEAQSAKNAATENARVIRRLQSERRLALTGTPIENRPEELWAAFDFLAPGFLGSLASFRKRYARPIERGEDHAFELLRARVQPLVLRRLKSEVVEELPPKTESVMRCEMAPAQRALYEHVAGELRTSLREKIESVGIERARMSILAALTRLRQICCDPALLPVPEGVKTPPSAKLALFAELLREALASERCVVVFSQFVEMQKRLISVIRELGVEPLWLHGATRHRDRVVAAFQDKAGPPVIVVSLKAGGTGITLTRADTVMHYEPWWNPAVERQATDRTHRIGQKKRVNVYKLIAARTIEERVLELAARKDYVADKLLGSEGALAKSITVQDVLQLLS